MINRCRAATRRFALEAPTAMCAAAGGGWRLSFVSRDRAAGCIEAVRPAEGNDSVKSDYVVGRIYLGRAVRDTAANGMDADEIVADSAVRDTAVGGVDADGGVVVGGANRLTLPLPASRPLPPLWLAVQLVMTLPSGINRLRRHCYWRCKRDRADFASGNASSFGQVPCGAAAEDGTTPRAYGCHRRRCGLSAIDSCFVAGVVEAVARVDRGDAVADLGSIGHKPRWRCRWPRASPSIHCHAGAGRASVLRETSFSTIAVAEVVYPGRRHTLARCRCDARLVTGDGGAEEAQTGATAADQAEPLSRGSRGWPGR